MFFSNDKDKSSKHPLNFFWLEKRLHKRAFIQIKLDHLLNMLYQRFLYWLVLYVICGLVFISFNKVLYRNLFKILSSLSSLCYFSDKPSSWMTVDTALFVTSAGETKEDSTFVCFTESKDKEVRLCVLRDIHVKKTSYSV